VNILFIGDIFGRPGRSVLKQELKKLQGEFDIDFTVANLENASSGKGVTAESYQELKGLGIDVFTSGNHIWSKSEIVPVLEDKSEPILRPANLPPGTPGRGVWQGEIGTTKVAVVNVMGRVMMKEGTDDPFRAVDAILESFKDHVILVDFHAEATSEKRALGFYLDGRVTALVGTHTHVPTADAQLLPKGTAYITDVGFTGPHQSVLGVDKDIIIHNFMHMPKEPHDVAKGPVELGAVVIKTTGTKATSIEHVRRIIEL